MSLIALALLTTNLAQQPQLWVPMLRFTGKAGVYKNFEIYRQELKRLPLLSPSEPKLLADGSMAFTDGTTALAIFDPTYKPMQTLLAKWQVIELIVKNGPNATHQYKNLPNPLHDFVYEWLVGMSKNYDDELRVHFLSEMSTQIDSDDKNARFHVTQRPIAISDTAKAVIDEDLREHGLKRDVRFDESKKRRLPFEPDVKVFVEDRMNYGSQVAAERKALEIFTHWLIKEHLNLDNKLINNLELKQLLNPLATILRSKTLGEYSQISPAGFKEAMDYIQKKGSAAGYQNSDSLRSVLNISTISTSGGFLVRLSDPDKKIIEHKIVGGVNK